MIGKQLGWECRVNYNNLVQLVLADHVNTMFACFHLYLQSKLRKCSYYGHTMDILCLAPSQLCIFTYTNV